MPVHCHSRMGYSTATVPAAVQSHCRCPEREFYCLPKVKDPHIFYYYCATSTTTVSAVTTDAAIGLCTATPCLPEKSLCGCQDVKTQELTNCLSLSLCTTTTTAAAVCLYYY